MYSFRYILFILKSNLYKILFFLFQTFYWFYKIFLQYIIGSGDWWGIWWGCSGMTLSASVRPCSLMAPAPADLSSMKELPHGYWTGGVRSCWPQGVQELHQCICTCCFCPLLFGCCCCSHGPILHKKGDVLPVPSLRCYTVNLAHWPACTTSRCSSYARLACGEVAGTTMGWSCCCCCCCCFCL